MVADLISDSRHDENYKEEIIHIYNMSPSYWVLTVFSFFIPSEFQIYFSFPHFHHTLHWRMVRRDGQLSKSGDIFQFQHLHYKRHTDTEIYN